MTEDAQDLKRLDRLAAYEDTGLEPEEVMQTKLAIMGKSLAEIKEFEGVSINRMIELAQAEKDGRLVVLPCKVKDEVYFPVTGRWGAATICNIELTSIGVRFGWAQYDVGPEGHELWADGCFLAEDIGKTVFLAREEAEAALKKREEADNETD